MKPYRSGAVGVALLLAVVSGGCGKYIDKLKARDQLNKGVASFRNAAFQPAIDHFQQAVALDPDLINARLYLAMSYFQQYVPGGESDENVKMAKQAIAKFEDVLKMDPNNSTALATIALIYYNLKDFDKAKEYQKKRLEIEPNNPEPYYWIGVLNWSVCFPRRMQLRKDLKINLPKDPAKPDVLPPLPEKARAELAEKNNALVDEAIKSLQKAIELKPNYDDAMAYLSLMDREKADLETDKNAEAADVKEAETWVQKALDTRKQVAEKSSSAGIK
ncbi:MAG TPA: tetratricopeptide repeat protein [Terriglobia bacterium]|nr:tetratricopeptide repeat protein [Terriglobia bacterium]